MKNRPLCDVVLLLIWFLIGLMLGVGLCQSAEAQVCRDGKCPPAKCPSTAIVRIQHVDSEGINYFTGTLVRWSYKHDLIITCGHAFIKSGKTIVTHADDVTAGANLLSVDHDLDLALLEVVKRDTQKIEIYSQPPAIGVEVAGFGFGWIGQHFREFRGRVLMGGDKSFLFSAAAADGDSGGPIINAQGKLVGVISSGDDAGTDGIRCDRILRFIDESLLGLKSEQKETSDPVSPPAPVLSGISGPIGTSGATLLNPLPWLPIVPVGPNIQQTTKPKKEQNAHSTKGQKAPSTGLGLLSELEWLPLAVRGGKFAAAAAGITIGTGLTGGTGWAAWMAMQGAMRLYKRRKQRKRGKAAKVADSFSGIARDDEEAKQLLQLSQLEGRSPVHDAIIGRFTFDTIEMYLNQQPTGPAADALRKLRFQIESRFNEVAPAAVLHTKEN